MLFWILWMVSALSPRNSAISDRQPLQTTSWLESHRSMAFMIASAPAPSIQKVNGTAKALYTWWGWQGLILKAYQIGLTEVRLAGVNRLILA